ncbi:hypothetical protein RFF05_02935 [Bengtsoniella intestinalis]|uniref:hypothetical protein n=1 Tax=Bengtsoniella intestinalis TaxID=3073143 RepID=UPI00391F1674
MSSFPIEMLQDVASRAPLNSTYTETVRVADYGDVYTPEIFVNFPDGSMKGYYYFSRYAAEDSGLTDYFSMPIRDNDMATVTMTSDGLGVHEINLALLDDSGFKWQRSTVFNGTDGFYVAMSDENSTTIHSIIFAIPEDGDTVKVASMEAVLTLPDPLDGQGLVKRENQNQLLIFTLGTIYIFDMDTHTVSQTIDTEGFEGWDVEQGDDYFVFLNGYTFQVYAQQDDGYALVLTGDYAQHLDTEIANYDNNRTMVYTQGRLLTAVRKWSWEDSDHLTIYVTMNTPDGCVFTGCYTSSLQQDSPDNGYMIENWDSTDLELLVI